MKIYITRPILQNGITMLKKNHEVIVNPEDRVLTKEELKQAVKGSDAIVALLTDTIDGELLEAAGPQLKIVANYAVGYDNIDLAAAKEKNVLVSNTPEVLSEAVAEHAFTLVMAVARRVVEADRFMRAGHYKQWEPLGFLGVELKGKLLGILGLGRIGSRVGEIGKSFGMHIGYYDIQRNEEFERAMGATFLSKEEVLQTADVVSVHVPLLESTRHFIGRQEFAIMKDTAILVNTSRGPVVDEGALVEALNTKTIFGAGLDVFEQEPKLSPGLAECDNVIITPHIASATTEAREAMARVAAENVLAALAGKTPPNLVTN